LRVIAVHNLKGGVGKTAAAVNIASIAAASGIPTLLWDLDAQGACTWYLAPDESPKARPPKIKKILSGKTPVGKAIRSSSVENLDLIPADLSFRNIDVQLEKHGDDNTVSKWLEPLGEDYGLVVLDCPPNFSRLAEQILDVADRVMVPLVPTWLSMHSWKQLQEFAEDRKLSKKKFLPFFSMVDRRKKLHRDFLENPPAGLKRLMPGYIPYASDVERMGEHRLPVYAFAPRSAAAQAYQLLWKGLITGKDGLKL